MKETLEKETNLHPKLLLDKNLVFDLCGFECKHIKAERESAEYVAYTFTLNDKKIIYRVAKVTPTKTGQFVTLWKRKDGGPIEPFELSDDFDFIIISVSQDHHRGQFILPKSLLYTKGVISTQDKEGKRAIRVYPPWDVANSKQAQKTQNWQLECFLNVGNNSTIDVERVRQLLS